MNTISSGKSQKIIIVMWALVAEELGWRGYLQEKIEAHVGDVLTHLIVGIIWTVWHFSGNLFTNIYRLNPNWNTGRMEPYMIVNTVYLFNFIIFVVWRCFTKREESIGMRGK